MQYDHMNMMIWQNCFQYWDIMVINYKHYDKNKHKSMVQFWLRTNTQIFGGRLIAYIIHRHYNTTSL